MLTIVAERSGLSIAAGSAVVALGAALLAIGLTQAAEGRDPLDGWWVRVGLVLVVLGTAWVFLSFLLALVAGWKNHVVYQRLGEALAKGEGLRRVRLGGHTPHPDSVEDWANRTRELILRGVGPAAVSYFDVYAGGAQPGPDVQKWEEALAYQLTRLKELMDQPIRARLDFPTKRPWFESFEAKYL